MTTEEYIKATQEKIQTTCLNRLAELKQSIIDGEIHSCELINHGNGCIELKVVGTFENQLLLNESISLPEIHKDHKFGKKISYVDCINQIINLTNDGLTQGEIGKIIGINQTQVSSFYRKYKKENNMD